MTPHSTGSASGAGADLGLVVVNYRTGLEARRAVEAALESAAGLSVDAVVVDNASGDRSLEQLAGLESARVVASERNLGFAAASNLGARLVGGRHLLILNPDMEPRGDAVRRLVEALDARGEAGLLGPRLLNPDGSLQYSCRTFYDLETVLVRRTPLKALFPNSRVNRDHLYADEEQGAPRHVDWLIGACLLVRRDLWQQLGGFDERFFLYFEDVDLCYRTWLAGHAVGYEPSAAFVHHHRRQSAGWWPSRAKLEHGRSALSFFAKWGRAGCRRPGSGEMDRRPRRPRLLFLSHDSTGPLRLRLAGFSRHLAERYEVVTFSKDRFFGSRPRRALAMAWSAVRLRPHAAVVFDVGSASLLWLGALRCLTRARVLLDTGDPYHELHRRTARSAGVTLALRGLVERLALGAAHRVVARGRGLIDALKSQGYNALVFIPDGVECDRVSRGGDAGLRRELGFEAVLVLATVGSLLVDARHGVTYGWDLVEALALLRHRPVKGLVVGDGPGRALLERRAAELGLGDRVVFAGQLPFDELVRYLGAVDVCLSTQSDDPLGRARTTAKLPLYMAAGRFVLASRVGEAERVLPESMLLSYRGELDPTYPRRLAERVEWLLEDPGRLAATAGLAEQARARYDYAGLAERLARAIEDKTCPR